MLSYERHPDRYLFANDDGVWTIFRRPIRLEGLYAGPGYIARLRDRSSGIMLVDDLRPPLDDGASVPDVGSLNDTYGGLGGFAWHHYPAGHGDPREISTRRHTTLWPHVGAEVTKDEPLTQDDDRIRLRMRLTLGPMDVVYSYEFERDRVSQWVTVIQGTKDFVGEPKVVAAVNPVGGADYTDVDVYDRGGGLARHIELANLPDAGRATTQLNQRHRARVRFFGDERVPMLNVVALGSPGPFERGVQWFGARVGFDQWAKKAQGRERPAAGEDDLPRRWEVIRRPHNGTVSCLFHGWEDGRGIGDRPDRARRMVPGEAWTVLLRYSLA